MSTYPGLVASTRESVSLDEDEPSDIEDEVFIRDGRNGYKLAEDRGVKRPLMAPRRKVGKPDLASRLKNRPPCRMLCIPCCYAFIALTIFLGLLVIVILLVAIFPLPLDTVKSWIVSKANDPKSSIKTIPCTDLKVTDVWTVTLPKLASESPIRHVDVNKDQIDDIVFGFGLGEDVQLPQQWFCPIFLNVKPPCQGGVIALDGTNGQEIWRRWLPHTIFTLHCNVDLTGDNISDCLASGKGGVLTAIDGHNGTLIWEFFYNKTSLVRDVYFGSFIPDQDGDGVSDVIASHTLQSGGKGTGYLLIISGKTGSELSRVSTPNSTEILFAPQYFVRNGNENTILFGTGNENTPGGLYIASLKDIYAKQMKPTILYKDTAKGILSPVIFADITGDKIDDIISAMFNSTIVAIDGKNLQQLWNYTVNNSETLSTPTPGYFNNDNVTDFLVKYQTGPGFPLYYYSQTIIIDGKTGKPIFKPVIDSVGTQMGGLTVNMENHGNDMFIHWISDCKNNEAKQDKFSFDQSSNIWQKTKADLCKLRFNSSMITKLYSWNQYNEPPGILLYTSENNTLLEYNNSLSPLDEVRQYLQENPDFDTIFRTTQASNINQLKNFNLKTLNNNFNKGMSSFRHRNDGQGLLKDYSRPDFRSRIPNMNKNNNNNNDNNNNNNNNNNNMDQQVQPDDKFDYDQSEMSFAPSDTVVDDMLDPSQTDYSDAYADDADRASFINSNLKPMLNLNSNRDPRSQSQNTNQQQQQTTVQTPNQSNDESQKSKKKNLADYGPNDYRNIYMARNRLLHDLNNLPTDILRETYIKYRKRQFRNNKFQQRDLRYHENANKTDDIEEQVKNSHFPESLWDLESEKELEDRQNDYLRGKRDVNVPPKGIPRISSTGVLLKPLKDGKSLNAIDIVFLTYWVRPKYGAYVILESDAECIKRKMEQSEQPTDQYFGLEKLTKQDLFTKICLKERGALQQQSPDFYEDAKNDPLQKSPYYNQISQLSLGQMTVYRLRIECKCQILKPGEICARILSENDQSWSSYMGVNGTGSFKTH